MDETNKPATKKKSKKRKSVKKINNITSENTSASVVKKSPAIDMGMIMRSAVDNAGVSIMMIDRDRKSVV